MVPKQKAQAAFEHTFGSVPERLFQAPGRVNLIGEHTDYNDGFVLPAAIDFHVVVAATPRPGRTIRLVAAEYENEMDTVRLDEPIEPRRDLSWANYTRGVLKELVSKAAALGGADLAISGNIPQGAGLSSSAALEVAIGQTFTSLFDLPLSAVEIALIGQEAENTFVGTKCGIMDQLISAQGEAGHALLIDCRSLETTPIKLPQELAILIIDSRVTRGLVDSEYNARRAQCEEAARRLGLKALRDISLDEFEARAGDLPPLVAKRARHVISENARTLDAVKALAAGDSARLSQLMAGSHASMRDEFEITVPPIDFIVETVSAVIGDRGGVRMTGGGFGGCVVALTPPDLIPNIEARLGRTYKNKTGLEAVLYVCKPVTGAQEI